MNFKIYLALFVSIWHVNYYGFGQDFTEKEKTLVALNAFKILRDYNDLINLIGNNPNWETKKKKLHVSNLIEMFLNPKIMVQNDLDPTNQMSKIYEVETYFSNLILWYPKGYSVSISFDSARVGKIVHYQDQIYYVDILVQKAFSGKYLNEIINNYQDKQVYRFAFNRGKEALSHFSIVGVRKPADLSQFIENPKNNSPKSISDKDVKVVHEYMKVLLKDYARCLSFINSPSELENDRDLFENEFFSFFSDKQATLYNDLSPGGSEAVFDINTYLKKLKEWYPKGLEVGFTNLDSSIYSPFEINKDGQFISRIYIDKYIIGNLEDNRINRQIFNLVFTISFQRDANNFKEFKIVSIERNVLESFQKESSLLEKRKKLNDFRNRKGFCFNPYLLLGSNKIIDNNLQLKNSYYSFSSPNLSTNGGVNFYYFVNNFSAFGLGFAYSKYELNLNLSGTFEDSQISTDVNGNAYHKKIQVEIDSTIILKYLSIPFTYKYVTSRPDKVGLFFEAGVNINILLSSTSDVNLSYYKTSGVILPTQSVPIPVEIDDPLFGFYSRNPNQSNSKLTNYYPITYSWRIMGGFYIPLTNFSFLYLGTEYCFSIQKINSDKQDKVDIFGYNQENLPSYLNNLGLFFCISFKIN